MRMVEYGKRWMIATRADFETALEILEENDFCADMSDDFMRAWNEKDEIAKQRADVYNQAVALGIA